jgi:hypothetical protein
VFSPSRRYKDWQLGRIPHVFEEHARKLVSESAEQNIVLDPLRDYIVVFQWMNGLNLEECFEQGILDSTTVEAISNRAVHDLQAKGFAVLDHKPNHVIVSVNRAGAVLQRRGRVVYGLADFELLVNVCDDSQLLDTHPNPAVLPLPD